MPKNTEKVRFYFRGEKIAKCIGTLAHNIPKQDQEIEGVLGNDQIIQLYSFFFDS